jgi:ribokinase
MISVFGSINVDLVCRTVRIARPGETVLSPGYNQYPGGKGANQAVAAARFGAEVKMIGAVGSDAFAAVARQALVESGVEISGVATVGLPTGVAFIVVSDDGENAITVASGANEAVSADYETQASTLVVQMELAIDVTLQQMRAARGSGTRTVLNFAPVPASLDIAMLHALMEVTDYLVVNEHELISLCDSLSISRDGTLLAKHVDSNLVVTRGGAGIEIYDLNIIGDSYVVLAPDVKVVDTTGAGDTFVGVLAAGLDTGIFFTTPPSKQRSLRRFLANQMAHSQPCQQRPSLSIF